MMAWIKVGGCRYLNMAHAIDVREGEQPGTLVIAFAAPQPCGVGAADWSVEAYAVTVRGEDADRVLRWLDERADSLARHG